MGNKKLVLIADDKDENRLLLKKIINSMDHDVLEASNGKEGLKFARSHKPDLIISDVLMPEMDGFMFCREVKKDDKLKNIPFIFYTATFASEKDEEFALSLGAEKYVIKPVEPDDFREMLEHLFEADENTTFVAPKKVIGEEKDVLRLYSERMVKKLEKKMLDLEKEISERKQIEKTLRDSEEKLLESQHLAKMGRWELDLINNHLHWSSEIFEIFEIDPGQFDASYENFLDAIHPEDRGKVDLAYNDSLKDQKPYNIEHRLLMKDGRIKWVNEICKTEFDTQGKALRSDGIIQDITDSKLAEDALTHSHNLMQYIIEHNRSAVAVHDKDMKYVYVSQRYLDDYKVREKDIIGKHHYEVFPDLPQKWRDVHQKALNGEISSAEDDPYEREDGSVDWTRWECRPWYEADGTIGGIIVYTEVITDRKKAEEDLRRSEEKMRSIFRVAPTGIGVVKDRMILEVNSRFCDMTGYSKQELIGHSSVMVYPSEEDYEYVGKEKYRQISESGTGVVETRFKKKDGSLIDVLLASTPIDINDLSKGVTFTALDITDRKKAEAELEAHRDHLEELVDERTSALQSVNEELEAFSYSVSHDLRAPLRSIDGFTKILMEEYVSKFDDEGNRLGSVIRNNAKKMGMLIDDLLAFSRTSRSAMSFSMIDMKNMAYAIYHELTDKKEREKIIFSLVDLPEVRGDTTMMRQVWMNLISNAIKFSSNEGKPEISVSAIDNENNIVYCVSDNGVGFNMKYADKLFGVFQRLHSENEFDGTGVGLALVQRIIFRHGGDIRGESEVGNGAKFCFSLPKKGE